MLSSVVPPPERDPTQRRPRKQNPFDSLTRPAVAALIRAMTSNRQPTVDAAPRWARRAWTFLWTGPVAGVAVYTVLFLWCLLQFGGGQYMGMDASDATAQIKERHLRDILMLQLQILGLYALVGATFGALASLTVRLYARTRRRTLPGGWRLAMRVIGLVLLYHGWFLGRAMVALPQLFQDQFHSRGGFWGLIHRALTDFLPLWAFDSVAAIYLLLLLVGTGLWVWQTQRRNWMNPDANWRLRYAVIGVLGLSVGCGTMVAWHEPAPPPTRNNLLIIAIDSLRPDRLDPSASRPLPHLVRFAGEAAQFESAWTVIPRTFPSWISILTGQYPHEHGVRHMFPPPAVVARSRETLISALRDRGYRTAVISDFAGDIFSRIQLGFEDVYVPRMTTWSLAERGSYEAHYHLLPYVTTILGGQDRFPILKLWERLADADHLTDQATRWIRNGDGRPFALVVFYSTPHIPYASKWPYYRQYTERSYDGPSRYRAELVADADQAEIHHVQALYDGALAATDAAVGRLLGDLRETGLLDQTTVVVTADHGENLYENGFGVGHGDHLRGSESLRIPLLVRAPHVLDGTPRIEVPVRSIDIGPTVLELMGKPPLRAASGRSLAPLARGQGSVFGIEEAPPVFFETGWWFSNPKYEALKGRTMAYAPRIDHALTADVETDELFVKEEYNPGFLVAKHRAILSEGHKLVYIPTRQSGVLWELYDVALDPDEKNEISEHKPELTKRLRRRLVEWMLSDPQMMKMGDYVVPKLPVDL